MRVLFATVLILFLGLTSPAISADVGIMDKDELKSMLGTDNLVVLDVREPSETAGGKIRAGRDWSSSEYKIQGAIRADPGKVSSWAGNYDKGKTVVLYCA